mgnify:CR=1 FL=1
MLKKSDIPNIIKTAVILFLITGIAALILAVVNNFTAPIIAENSAKKQAAAMQNVLKDAEFSEENLAENVDDPEISEIYKAQKDGSAAGYVVMVNPNGYNGAISMVVGIDAEGKVSGIDIISQSETAGLGANCVKDEFKDQFVGKSGEISVVKNDPKDNEIDAITSATITSKAVTSGVNKALAAAEKLEEAGK